MTAILRAALAALATCMCLSVTGCVHVPIYERAALTHPSMAATSLGGAGESHMQAIQEGATGGAIGAEGGCGCN